MPIAHFAKVSSLMLAIVTSGLAILLPFLILYPLPWHHEVETPFTMPVRIIALACAVLIFLRSIAILKQVILDGRKAIWIDDTRLNFLDTYYRSWFVRVPLADIKSVELGTIGTWRLESIVLNLKDGTQKTIRAWPWDEAGATVVARLDEVLARRPIVA